MSTIYQGAAETFVLGPDEQLSVDSNRGIATVVYLGEKDGEPARGATPISGALGTFGPHGVVSRYRVGVSAGVATCTVAPAGVPSGFGTRANAAFAVREDGLPFIHRSVVDLANLSVTFTDDAGVGQWASVPLYNFPAGNVVTLAAVLNGTIRLNESWWIDTIAGDVSIGSVAADSAAVLATTKQNIIPTTEIAALVGQAGPLIAQSTGSYHSSVAGGTAAKAFLNIRIDDNAAHMPNAVTNGAFATDTDWTKGTGWTIGTGVATKAAGEAADLVQAAGLLPGVSYSVAFTATRTAGTVRVIAGGTLGTVRSTSNTFTETLVAGADGTIAIRADADFAGTIDNVSAYPLTGTGTIDGTVTLLWLDAGNLG